MKMTDMTESNNDDVAKNHARERRVYKRFETDLPVTMVAADDQAMNGRIRDLSLAGLLIQCDRQTMLRISPVGDRTTPDKAPAVTLTFDLPRTDDSEASIMVDAKVVMIRRFSEQNYYLHIKYNFFQGNGYNLLEDFIDAMTEIGATD